MLTKHRCILGVLASERGLAIRDGLRSWLDKDYDVVEVSATPPNDKEFERPFLKAACRLSIETGEPVLYVHTKGAANKFISAPMVRDFWEQEFTVHKEEYFGAVRTGAPTVAAPYISSRKHVCWFNGFVLNPAAARAMLPLLDSPVCRDRFWYEQGLLADAGVHVLGRLAKDLDSPQAMCAYLPTAWSDCLYQQARAEGRVPAVAAMSITRDNVDSAHRTVESILSVSRPVKLVLTASMDDFPGDIEDLPSSLLACLEDRHVCIFWTPGHSMSSFESVLYVMNTVPRLPVVTVGTGCVYTEDYVSRLYSIHANDPYRGRHAWSYGVDMTKPGYVFPDNRATLYPPDCFRGYGLTVVAGTLLGKHDSDVYAGTMCKCLGMGIKEVAKQLPCTDMDGVQCGAIVHRDTDETVRAVLAGHQWLVSNVLQHRL